MLRCICRSYNVPPFLNKFSFSPWSCLSALPHHSSGHPIAPEFMTTAGYTSLQMPADTTCKLDPEFPLSEKPLTLKGQMGKPLFEQVLENSGFPGKNLDFYLHPLCWRFSQANCQMLEAQSEGPGARAGVERSRQVSSTAKLYIVFLDIFNYGQARDSPLLQDWSSKGRGRREPKLKNEGGQPT